MIRKIITDIDTLHKVSRKVKEHENVDMLVKDLKDTMRRKGSLGLAAPQIGKHLRVFVIRSGYNLLPFINPLILEKEHSYNTKEACESLPKASYTVERYHRIVIEFDTMDGKRVVKSYAGPLAQIIQHEYDHLNGRLIGD